MQGGTPREPREPFTFELPQEQREAIEKLAGDRKVRLDGRIEQGKLRLVGIHILPVGACNSAFDPVE
jgi:hypothetical protein